MKPLPQTFREDGFVVRVVKRKGNVALLVKSKLDQSESYEVVIIQTRPEETIYCQRYPAREVMPHSEQWGRHGWSPIDEESAELLFQQLTEKVIAA